MSMAKNVDNVLVLGGGDGLAVREILKYNEVKKVTSPRIHFGSDHPLMRTHQLVMKTAMNQMSFAKNEEKKEEWFLYACWECK